MLIPRFELWDQWGEIMRSQCKHEGLTGVKGADLFYEEHAIAMNKGAATNVWMKNFGGRFVPIACLTADVFGEVWRNQDTRATIEKSGPRYQ